MTIGSTGSRSQMGAVSPRILVAVHGYEAQGWPLETCRVLGAWVGASVRLLAVLDVPSVSFTSLAPLARRAYAGARAEWTAIERHRLERAVDALRLGLPGEVEVAWAAAPSGDIARTIAEHACAWPADVVTIGAPAPAPWSWLRPGPVHQRLVRVAHCTVLVVATPGPVTTGHRRLVGSPQALPAEQRA